VVDEGTVELAKGAELWRLTGEVVLPDGPVRYDQRLTRSADGAYTLRTTDARMRVDPSRSLITVDADGESLTRQLVTTYGLPLLLHDVGSALIPHGCAAVPPSGRGAYVVCGESGSGKSSLLIALLDAGWRAVSEDVSVIDLRDDVPTVWPGPPWVRRAGAGPAGSTPRFRTPDKTAWDLTPWQVDEPVAVDRIVFMERSGGDGEIWEAVGGAEAIRRLSVSTVWLLEQASRAAATFDASARLAARGTAARLRLPTSHRWTSGATSILTEDAGGR
jgi:hypothetical protein